MTIGAFQILGARFFSTHHVSAADALAGRERELATPGFPLLAGRARRFTSLVTQMQIDVCGSLLDESQAPIAVFATCHGEIKTAETLISDIRDNAMVSSARFALSVHNTPSGLYSVATGSPAPTTTVTGSNAIAGGWLEAALTVLAEQRRVLLTIADEPVPAVFGGPPEHVGVAAAFLLGPASAEKAVELAVIAGSAGDVATVATLARTVVAVEQGDAASIDLGMIAAGAPGTRLELRVGGPRP
ncbi:MAG TPA: beta-ketoacyl synthase chain length factor [Kofleriaceae bacterium]|jgi:hypothetical protein